MTRYLLLCTLLIAVLITPLGAVIIGELEFGEDLPKLLVSAADAEKPAVVKFYTDWCKWCKVMDDSTFPSGYVQKFLKNFELGMINAEVDTLAAARFGVRSYPTTVLFAPTGVEIDRIVGYYPPDEFVGAIVKAFAGIGTLEYYLGKLQESPDDPSLLFETGQKYRWRGEYDSAESYFRRVMATDPMNESGLAAQSSYNIAHMRFKLQDYQGAIAEWKRTSELFPDDDVAPDAELMAAYCYQKAKDFAQARRQYELFLQKHPDSEEREWINEQLTAMRSQSGRESTDE